MKETLRRHPGWLLLALLLALSGREGEAQWKNAALGGATGVAGGVVITLGIVVARAQLQHQYLDSAHDLIHWQTIPMIATPAAGVAFGLAGDRVLQGSITGSLAGLGVGAAMGAGVGWLVSSEPEAPWAGGIIGSGAGLTLGGLLGAYLAWRKEERRAPGSAAPLRLGIQLPLPR